MALTHGRASSYRRGCRCSLCKRAYCDDQLPRQKAARQRTKAELTGLRQFRDGVVELLAAIERAEAGR